MIHRGIEYSIRMSLGREEWIWTLSLMEGRVINGRYRGTRDGALEAAQRAIDRWLGKHNRGRDYENIAQILHISPASSQLAVPLEDAPTACSNSPAVCS
jgi:hypothetical protein